MLAPCLAGGDAHPLGRRSCAAGRHFLPQCTITRWGSYWGCCPAPPHGCRCCSLLALPCTACRRGLAGPDSSSEEENEEEGGSDEEAGSGSEGEGGSGSEEEEEEEEQDDDKVFRQRRPVLPRRGQPEEEEEPLGEAELEEWGVGAMAANPEEPVSGRGGGGVP